MHDYNVNTTLFARISYRENMVIVFPAVETVFQRAIRDKSFNIEKDKILDFGCGAGTVSIGFLRNGINVDMFDPSTEMIKTADRILKEASFSNSTKDPEYRLTDHIENFDNGSFAFAMMCFVHQIAESKKELTTLFEAVGQKIKNKGMLVIVGAHPSYLHIPHSSCEYDVINSDDLKDGDTYTGRLYDELGHSTYDLKCEHFWSVPTLISIAHKSGFSITAAEEIADPISGVSRKSSKEPPFIMLSFLKKALAPDR